MTTFDRPTREDEQHLLDNLEAPRPTEDHAELVRADLDVLDGDVAGGDFQALGNALARMHSIPHT